MALHQVDLTGDYRTNIYVAARRLLANGADPADEIETRRHGKLSMSGTVGVLAGLEVVDDHGRLRLRRYKALSATTLARWAAKSGSRGITLAETLEGAPVAPVCEAA
jgi:hypothetical protein